MLSLHALVMVFWSLLDEVQLGSGGSTPNISNSLQAKALTVAKPELKLLFHLAHLACNGVSDEFDNCVHVAHARHALQVLELLRDEQLLST